MPPVEKRFISRHEERSPLDVGLVDVCPPVRNTRQARVDRDQHVGAQRLSCPVGLHGPQDAEGLLPAPPGASGRALAGRLRNREAAHGSGGRGGEGLSARGGVGGPDLRGQGELPSPCPRTGFPGRLYGLRGVDRTHGLSESCIQISNGPCRAAWNPGARAETLACWDKSLLFAKSLQWVCHSRAQGWHKRCGYADAEQCCPCDSERDGIQRADIEEKRRQ